MRLSTIFLLGMLALVVLVAASSLAVAVPFVLGCLIVASPVVILHRLEEWRGYLLLICGTLFVTYLSRVPVLLYFPESYSFARKEAMTPDLLAATTWSILLPLLCCCLGFVLEIRGGQNRLNSAHAFTPSRRSIVVANVGLVLVISATVLISRAFLAFVYGVGVKMVESRASNLNFLTQLIPEMTAVALCALLLLVHRNYVKKPWLLAAGGFLVCDALLTILCGSKAGVLMVIFACVTVFLMRFRDRPVKKSTLMTATVSAVCVASVSIALASTIKWATRNESDLQSGIVSGINNFEFESHFQDGLLMASLRTSAFDGSRYLEFPDDRRILTAFDPINVAHNTINRLLPGVGTSGMTMSKAVAVYVFEKPDDFGATLGLFPTMTLMFGRFSLLAIFAYGYISTFVYKRIARIRDADLQTCVQFVFLFATFRLIMSGAFDQILSEMVTYLAHTVVIFYLLSRFGFGQASQGFGFQSPPANRIYGVYEH